MGKVERYRYEVTPKDLANFESIWQVMWEPVFCTLSPLEYNAVKMHSLEVFLTGVNQHKFDIKLYLEEKLKDS